MQRTDEMADGDAYWFDFSIFTVQVGTRTVSLSGIPHASTEDDVYKGFFIPKGLSRLLRALCPSIIRCQSFGPKDRQF
jgi:hypothetical protein